MVYWLDRFKMYHFELERSERGSSARELHCKIIMINSLFFTFHALHILPLKLNLLLNFKRISSQFRNSRFYAANINPGVSLLQTHKIDNRKIMH